MESTTAAGGGGGIGGPAPFLLKTYDMVDDSSTDEIVSWSSTNQSFVVWNPPEFSRLLLPIYFKHNNFSSFIRQLNTYGFHKVDPVRWEFANEDFVKDEKLLLKNIQRRKPIHSHSHSSGSVMDPERMAFDEEIERLTREKVAFETSLSRFEQKQMAAKAQLEDLTHQISGMEQRQANLLEYLEKAIRNPTFVEHLTQKIDSTDILANNKKRRLPRADHSQPVSGISFTEDQASSRGESENMVKQDLSSKLSLELSPAFSDINLASNSTDKNAGSAEKKSSEGDINDISKRKETRSYAIETLDLSDTGTSFASEMGPSLPQEQEQNSLHHCLNSSEESDCHVSFHLNLTLASSPLQANKSQHSSTKTKFGHKLGNFSALRPHTSGKEVVFGSTSPKTRTSSGGDASLPCLNQAPTRNEGPPPALVRVNDVFWEQFLTESPGSSDAREAKS